QPSGTLHRKVPLFRCFQGLSAPFLAVLFPEIPRIAVEIPSIRVKISIRTFSASLLQTYILTH
ncbi:hypothetical protein, partial [Prevotella sp. MGM2]|uniref:hypothetical protein n=1 Tax=Prevotella sp. MGM2 TaxID=2033406 RepID=UPI001CBABB42